MTKHQNLLKSSNEIHDIIVKYKGKMDVVPAGILHSLIKACIRVFNSTNNEEETRVFASILEIIFNPKSYSDNFNALKQKIVSTNMRERSLLHYKFASERITGVSHYSTSPLLHNMIKDGMLISSVINQIRSSESDETLSVLGEILFHLVRLAEKGEFKSIADHGLFDGVRRILARCNSFEGLHFALEAVLHSITKVNHLETKLNLHVMVKLRDCDFEIELLEIALGLRTRGLLYEKNKKEYQDFFCYCRTHDEEEFISKYFSNDDGSEMTRRKKTRETQSKKKTATQTKNNSKKNKDSKRKQKNQKMEISDEQEEFITIEDDKSNISSFSASDPLSATEQCYGDIGNEEHVRLPLKIRLEAVRVSISFDNGSLLLYVPKRLLTLLSEGLKLPDGAEDEYLHQKTKELKGKASLEIEEEKNKEELEKEMAKKKSKTKAEISSDKINDKTEDGKEKAGDEDQDCSDADAITNIEGYDACKRSIPLTACDTTETIEQVQETLLMTAHFLKKIYTEKYIINLQLIPELIFATLFDRLNRLMNFPFKRFYTLAGSCIELIFAMMPDSLFFRCLPSVEEQIASDLHLIEKEMTGVKSNDSLLAQSSTELSCNSEKDEFSLNEKYIAFPNDFCLTALKPSLNNCLAGSDFTIAYENYMDALLLIEASTTFFFPTFNSRYCLSQFTKRNCEEINQRSQQLHYSFIAYRFRHNVSCLLSAIASHKNYADEIILRPVFGFLMSKFSFRFPVCAADSVGYSENKHFYPSSLESVPIAIYMVVTLVLLNVVKELPYAFEMGYVTSLLKWMVNLSPCSPWLLIHGIIRIREAAVLFSLPSRKLRLELAVTANEAIQEKKNRENYEKFLFKFEFGRKWEGISALEVDTCLPKSYASIVSQDDTTLELLDFAEDEEEVEKKDDTGTLLYCRLEDDLEETGIRDLLETFPQDRNIEPFWLMKGTIPTKAKYVNERMYNYLVNEMLQRGPKLQM
eukprot:MONOS_7900.1-p1 / transcript=MONOS_7900.1 / gene=MONOS_7900 / organism=Monocercomonoides_exilis_PA203 / gene_product=unspecified product / transcript_product=unspecified product / location=Mono_scaffold00283:26302-29515(+) / protein_length=978 / sequence_SO=supercontig / SO=protein_coding / is_pseudo=false